MTNSPPVINFPDISLVNNISSPTENSYTTTTDANGNYSFSDLPPGVYRITPSQSGYTFGPASRQATLPPDAVSQDFSRQIDSTINPGEMIDIPAGEFQMGCDFAHNSACPGMELPMHPVYLDAYRIDKYEVTNGQYAACVDAGVLLPSGFSQLFHPACILWQPSL